MNTFPFGKYKGEAIEDIPTDYLLWAKTIAKPFLKEVIETELKRRAYASAVNEPDIPRELMPLYCELIKEGYRALAKKYHPDSGGKTADMQKLNSLKEIMEKK